MLVLFENDSKYIAESMDAILMCKTPRNMGLTLLFLMDEK
jgi:hypothetical protein